MKKTLVASILGLATMTSVLAQGNVSLDTYQNSGNLITFDGNPVGPSFTAGFYYLVGSQVSAVNASFTGDPAQIPTYPGLTLAVGTGATSAIGTLGAGFISAIDGFTIPGSLTGDYTVTIVAIAYQGPDYASSLIRGHSQAFTMTAKLVGVPDNFAQASMPGFSVVPVPEPSTFALAGLGLASLLIFRRRK